MTDAEKLEAISNIYLRYVNQPDGDTTPAFHYLDELGDVLGPGPATDTPPSPAPDLCGRCARLFPQRKAS